MKRLEPIFELAGKKTQGVDCPAIDGILEEAQDVAGEVEDKPVLDAALIAVAQAVRPGRAGRIESGTAPASDEAGCLMMSSNPSEENVGATI